MDTTMELTGDSFEHLVLAGDDEHQAGELSNPLLDAEALRLPCAVHRSDLRHAVKHLC